MRENAPVANPVYIVYNIYGLTTRVYGRWHGSILSKGENTRNRQTYIVLLLLSPNRKAVVCLIPSKEFKRRARKQKQRKGTGLLPAPFLYKEIIGIISPLPVRRAVDEYNAVFHQCLCSHQFIVAGVVHYVKKACLASNG